MSQWGDKVRRALTDPRVPNGIAQVVAAAMKDHIDENRGRGKDGKDVAHEPIKPLFGSYWTRKPKANEIVVKSRTTVSGKRTVTEYLVQSPGYRNGGQPLRDTGQMYRELSAKGRVTHRHGMKISLQGPIYALFQDRGFKTKKPNYIPLTKKGKRGHGTGQNPNAEGLIRGKDFTMAWGGVTVPSRPFLMPTRGDMTTIGKSIYMSLKKLLKGR